MPSREIQFAAAANHYLMTSLRIPDVVTLTFPPGSIIMPNKVGTFILPVDVSVLLRARWSILKRSQLIKHLIPFVRGNIGQRGVIRTRCHEDHN
jgi:hypothetical protein